ncbi:MAG TPA: sigma factor-like helix-turn-helix DNA-binding protein [Dehalococcoidales bacterium]|nr:sigma factor-like helix-turn-helix DNA-binding protein [Dehalococcoidales bacterium]
MTMSPEQAPEIPDDPPEVKTIFLCHQERQRLRQALEILPVQQRETVVLRYFSDLTVPGVAEYRSQVKI